MTTREELAKARLRDTTPEAKGEGKTRGAEFHRNSAQALRELWRDEKERAERAEADLKNLGVVELMVRNVNVDSWVREWEARALKAEAKLAAVKACGRHEISDFDYILADDIEEALATGDEAGYTLKGAVDYEAAARALYRNVSQLSWDNLNSHDQETCRIRARAIVDAALVREEGK